MYYYDLKPGDRLSALFGRSWRQIFGSSANSPLRGQYPDPATLQIGARIYVDDEYAQFSKVELTKCLPFSSRALFVDAMPRSGIVAEVGVWAGDHADTIYRRNQPKKLHLIDCWCPLPEKSVFDHDVPIEFHDKLYRHVCNRFDEAIQQAKIVVHKGWSDGVARTFPEEYFDWIYIDASHVYVNVLLDLVTYFPTVKVGGCIMGHDYRPDFPDVIQAVTDFQKWYPVELVATAYAGGPICGDCSEFLLRKSARRV